MAEAFLFRKEGLLGFMNVSIIKTAEKLKSDRKKIAEIFSGFSEIQLNHGLYSSEFDDWRVRDVLAHFIFAEKGFLIIFNEIVQGGEGSPVGFDIDLYNQRMMREYKNQDIQSLINDFTETRTSTLEFIESLNHEDLKKVGRHPALGMTTLAEMLKMIYLHNQLHLRDVKKILE